MNTIAQSVASADASAAPQPHVMQCMEIWGGTEAADEAVAVPGLDVRVHALPHDGAVAGGDIHYLSMCGGGNIVRFLVADVSGHGQVVSELSSDLRGLLRRHINRFNNARMARSLNNEFGALAADGRFATAVMGTYFAPTDQFIIVNAGHPRPLWYSAEHERWQLLREDSEACDPRGPFNLPLGVIDRTDYRQFAVTLGEHDLVLMYTDSLTESTDAGGRQLGEQGLLELARTLDPTAREQLGRHLLDAVARHRGGLPADDDLTLLTLHHNASDPDVSMGQRVKALARMVGILPV